jgi:hypothetical protein
MRNKLPILYCVYTAVLSLATVPMPGTSASAETLDIAFQLAASGVYGVSQFSPSLGTLQSVTLTATGDAAYSPFNLENIGTAGGTVQLSIDPSWDLQTPGVGIGGTCDSGLPDPRVSFAPFDGALDMAGPDSYNYVPQYPSLSSGDSSTASGAVLANYIGGGSVSLTCTLYEEIGYTPNKPLSAVPVLMVNDDNLANQGYSLDTPGEVDGSLTYTYTPLPEPLSLSMLGSAIPWLGAVLYLRRRRRAKA